jgi:hypothetical protein
MFNYDSRMPGFGRNTSKEVKAGIVLILVLAFALCRLGLLR